MNEVRLWRNAVIVAYSASGLAFASWVSRIPAIRDALHLNPATIGALLLCMTLGSFASVSASGLIVVRLGTRRTIGFGSLIVGTGMLVTGFGAGVLGNPVVTGCGLAVIGVGTASWNTASNVEGAAVERALGKHIMPALHGSFSAGTVVGAGLGALAAAIHLPVVWHLGLMGLLVATSVGIATRYFRADLKESITAQPLAAVVDMSADPATGPLNVIDTSAPEVPGGRRLVAQAWRHPRTLLLGLLVLGLTLAEGAAGDWVALALADGHGANNATGALGYGIFVAAMTLGRFGGTPVLDRFGRVPVLRVCAAMAVVGLALFVFAPALWVALVALVLWGVGASLGFPVGMSAASDDPIRAAARVSVVSTIGYGAFLCGPPLLGLLANHVGILHSLLAVLVMLVLSFLLAPFARKETEPEAVR